MKQLFALLPLALFVLMSSSQTHGGEWHSAGAAPAPPYYPHLPANFACEITAMTSDNSDGFKEYRIDPVIEFKSQDFQEPGLGSVYYVIKGESDPGMNGQSFSLSFNDAGNGDEYMNLRVSAVGTVETLECADGKVKAGKPCKKIIKVSHQFSAEESGRALRSQGQVKAKAYLSLDSASSESRHASMEVVCKEKR